MRVIVLAAGQGTRLRPHTNALPKALVPLEASVPLLAHTIGVLMDNPAIQDVRIVTGYCSDRVEVFLENWKFGRAHAAFNARFASHGPSLSVWTGIEDWDGPVIVMNGDTYFERRTLADVVRRAVAQGPHCTLFGSSVDAFASDDVRISVAQDNVIRTVGKHLSDAESSMKSAGIFAVRSAEHASTLKRLLSDVSSNQVQEPKTWHEIINNMIDLGIPVQAAGMPINGWREVDCSDDLVLAQKDYRRHKIDQFRDDEWQATNRGTLPSVGAPAA